MITFQEAQQLIIDRARSFGTETIGLEDADGRIVASDVLADRDYPPFNRSAMDGYAIKIIDWENGLRTFTIADTIYAGSTTSKALSPGECFKIMTGAAVPLSANTVIRREDTLESTQNVELKNERLELYQNIARQGEDLNKGELAIRRNTLCTPAVIGTLASLGQSVIQVKKLPSVALFTTGNEVKQVYEEVNAVEIRNSNSWFLQSSLKRWNIAPLTVKHIIDNIDSLKSTVGSALNCDIVIMSGGVSAGDADYVPGVLEALGVKKLFHKVAIKPGKPIWCGELPNGGMVFALPGNPFSCLVNFKLFIEPYLSTSLGLGFPKMETIPFNGKRLKKANLDEFFPVQIEGDPSELNMVQINGSGDIRLGLYADAIAHHPMKNPELLPGTMVSYYRLR